MLRAEARFVRDPAADSADTTLARARLKARVRVEEILQMYDSLGCKPDGLADALVGIADAVGRKIATDDP
jgi:hypothetical protein